MPEGGRPPPPPTATGPTARGGAPFDVRGRGHVREWRHVRIEWDEAAVEVPEKRQDHADLCSLRFVALHAPHDSRRAN